MAAGSASSREQNFWPGFVDALTNVVLVMVFVVVVFTISLIASAVKLMNLHIDRQIEQKLLQQRSEADTRIAQIHAQLDDERLRVVSLQEESRRLKTELQSARNAQAEGRAAPPPRSLETAPPVIISGKLPLIILSYAPGVTTLESKLFDLIDGMLGDRATIGRWQVVMHAHVAEASPSEARRLAFYRLGVLRDHFVSRGADPGRIETIILDARSRDGRSQVSISVRKPD